MQQSRLVLTSTKQIVNEESLRNNDIDSPLCFIKFEVYELYMEQGKDECIKNMFSLLQDSELIIDENVLILRDKENGSDITSFTINKEDEDTEGFLKAYKENNFVKVSITLEVQTNVIANFYGLWFKDKWELFDIQHNNHH